MKGLELSRKFYETHGKRMIEENFPDYKSRIAVGLVGEGSECLGYDDEISMDHDFGPSFCMWLEEADFTAIGRQLQDCYEKLPREFEGITFQNASAYGKERRGALSISRFYEKLTGSGTGEYDWQDFLFVPEYSFATAVNGAVFVDELGEFTRIREKIENAMPRDIWLKKIAARAAGMAQSGQYNFSRCLSHGEYGASVVALSEFARQTAMMVYLLNHKFCPYYKWMFRGMKELSVLGGLAGKLEQLLVMGNSRENFPVKRDLVEQISQSVIDELKNRELADGDGDYLEAYAFSVMERIENPQIRGLHVLQG